MNKNKTLKPLPAKSIFYTGHYVDHELVKNIDADCDLRVTRAKNKFDKRYLITVGGAGAQGKLISKIIKHFIPLVKNGSASLFINVGDHKNVYITEHNARKIVTKPVNSGFIARANAFHYPEMQIFSLRSYNSLIAHSRREFAVRDYLVNRQWRQNGVITPLDFAASSRINKVDGDPKCYPPCGRKTISGNTFTIDKEYPEYLSSAYMTFSSPAHACFLPVPMTLRNIPEKILDGSYSMHSFKLMDDKKPLLPAAELAALEKRLSARHDAAVEKARVILRTSTSTNPTAQDLAAQVLNKAFEENFNDISNTLKLK